MRRRGPEDKLGDEGRALRELLNYAVRAPSIQNTQPWQFRLQGDQLFVVSDHSRLLAVADPSGRELTISVGAAIGHLEAAAAAAGLVLDVELLPDRSWPEAMARVAIGGEQAVDPWALRLREAIAARHTVRAAFDERAVSQDVQTALGKAAAGPGTRLVGLNTDHAKGAVAGLVAEADRRLFKADGYRSERADWTRATRSEREDGVPAEAQGFSGIAGLVAPLVLRFLDSGDRHASQDLDLVSHAPMLVMVVTEGDHARSWLEAGRSLSRLLLEATAHDLKASFFSQPLQVRTFRLRIRQLLPDHAWPQLLLRLGYGPDGAPSPRRLVTELLKVRGKGEGRFGAT